MEIVLLDELKSRRNEIAQMLEKKRHTVISCASTNEFIAAIAKSSVGMFVVDVESWLHGRAIYSYFAIGKKMEHAPAVMYNAPQNFSVIADRTRNDKDFVVPPPFTAEAVIDAVAHNL